MSKIIRLTESDLVRLVRKVIKEEITSDEIQNLGLIAQNLSRKYSNQISAQKDKMGIGNVLLNKHMDQEVLKFQKLFNSMISKAERGNVFFGMPKLKEDGFIGNKTIEAMNIAENRFRGLRRGLK